jgi:hypothetical protein
MDQNDDDVQQQLLALEQAGWDSLSNGTGSDFYGSLMAPDGVMVLANGMVLDRDQVVESLREAPPWDDYRIEEPRVVSAGAESAALVYRGVARREGGGPDLDAVMTSVYVPSDDGWELALFTQTPIPG